MRSFNPSDALPAGALATISRQTCITCLSDLTDVATNSLSRFVSGITEGCGISDSEREHWRKAFSDPRSLLTLVLSTNDLEVTMNFLPKRTG